jgi:hypothetical protein
MTNDVRDERLSRLLDAAANRIDVTPHIEPVVQRGTLRRGVRTTAMVAAVAVFVGAVGYGALRARDSSAPGIDPSTWNEYSNPDGWTSRYPDGWIVQPFAGPVTKVYLSGAFFSNVAYDFHHPDLGPNDFTTGWDLSTFPRDGVAVEFERFVGGPPGMQAGPDTPFPLSLETTPVVQSSSTPESGGQHSIDIVHDGSRYTLNVWFGAESSQADREIARLMVSTFAFPRARSATNWSTYNLQTIALTMDYPSDWRLQPFDEFASTIGESGVLVSNTSQEFHHPDLGPDAYSGRWVMRDLPPDGIVLAIQRIEGGLLGPEKADSSFPLTRPTRAMHPRTGEPVELWRPFWFGGRSLTLRLWVGSEASAKDQAIMDRIIGSIRPTTVKRSQADASESAAPVPVEYAMPFFPYHDGWHTRDFGFVPRGDATGAWASTTPFKAADRSDTAPAIPPATIAALPPDGIVVTVEATPWSFDPDLGPYPPAADRPLDLGQATLRGPTAEEPPGDYSILEIQPGYLLVRIYFGVANPSPDLVALAQRELDTVEIPPVCPMPATGGFGATPSATEGAPGETVTIDGPMPFQHEDGSYDHTGGNFMSAWWNASPDDWEALSSSTATPSPATTGPLLRLGESGRGACSFSIAFTVPDVPPGSYPIVVMQESPNSSTMEAALTFTVR